MLRKGQREAPLPATSLLVCGFRGPCAPQALQGVLEEETWDTGEKAALGSDSSFALYFPGN